VAEPDAGEFKELDLQVPSWSHLLSAVCQYRVGRPGRFGHMQWHQIDRG